MERWKRNKDESKGGSWGGGMIEWCRSPERNRGGEKEEKGIMGNLIALVVLLDSLCGKRQNGREWGG